MGRAMVAGGMDHGASMAIGPHEMILLVITVIIVGMWLDRNSKW
jgi:hypothetical protein